MIPRMHLIFGVIFVTFLYFIFYPILSIFDLAVILLSSILIDVDHYFYYVLKKRDLNPFNAYHWYKKNVKKIYSLNKEKRREIYFGFYIFHGIEILIILFFLGKYVYPIFTFILIGFIFHLFLDFVSEIIWEQRFDKISFIYNLLTFKNRIHIDEV